MLQIMSWMPPPPHKVNETKIVGKDTKSEPKLIEDDMSMRGMRDVTLCPSGPEWDGPLRLPSDAIFDNNLAIWCRGRG